MPKGPAAAGLLPESGFNLEEHVEGLEKEYITQALQKAGGVQVKAAELLGIPYRSFRYYAKKYNLKVIPQRVIGFGLAVLSLVYLWVLRSQGVGASRRRNDRSIRGESSRG